MYDKVYTFIIVVEKVENFRNAVKSGYLSSSSWQELSNDILLTKSRTVENFPDLQLKYLE